MLNGDFELLLGIASVGMVDDIAGAFLQGQCQTEDVLISKLALAPKLLQSLHGPHDFLRCCLQFEHHAPASKCLLSPPILMVRMAISSDCGAVPAKARTFWSNPDDRSGADLVAKAIAS